MSQIKIIGQWRRFAIVSVMAIARLALQAQSFSVNGVVNDAAGTSLPGTSVQV